MKTIHFFLFFFILSLSTHAVNSDSLALTNHLSIEGMQLYHKGKYKAAEAKFRQALAIDTLLFRDNHYQRIIYTGMWLGNTLCKLGRTKEAINGEYTAPYCFAEPVDFRKMEEVDSLGALGNKLKEQEKWNESYLIWKKRQILLDTLIPRTHIWNANNLHEIAYTQNKRLNSFEIDSVKQMHEMAKEVISCMEYFITSTHLYLSNDSSKKNVWRHINFLLGKALECCHVNKQPDFSPKGNDIVWRSIHWADSIFHKQNPTPIEEYFYREKLRNTAINYSYRLPYASKRRYIATQIALHNCLRMISINDSIQNKDQWRRKVLLLQTLSEIYSDLGSCPATNDNDTAEELNIYDASDIKTVQDSLGMELVNQQAFKALLIDITSSAIDSTGNARQSHFSNMSFKTMLKRLEILKTYDYPQYINDLEELSSFYIGKNLYDKAIEIYHFMMEYYKNNNREKYYDTLLALANLYKKIGLYAFDDTSYLFAHKFKNISNRQAFACYFYNAIDCYEQYLKGKQEESDSVKFDPSWIIDKALAELYYHHAMKKKDNISAQHAYNFLGKYLAEGLVSDIDKPLYIRRMAECKIIMGTKDAFESIDNNQREEFEKTMIAFMYATGNEKKKFWNDYIFNENLEYVHHHHTMPHSAKVAYNANLYKKGILLGASRNLRDVISQSTDKHLQQLSTQLQELRKSASISDSLKVQNLEREILLICKNRGNYNSNLVITWKDVKKNLANKDLAIEFYKTWDGNYGAVLLSNKEDEPQLVILFTQTELDKYKDNYFSPEASSLVWKKLLPYMQGKKNIYFATDGELHNIPIEYMPAIDGKGMLSDSWHFFRLSSTRELVNHSQVKYHNTVIYGGLKYSLDTSSMQKDALRYPPTNDTRSVDIATGIAMVDRAHSGVSDLKYTKIEASKIKELLDSQKIICHLYSDSIGTETSFKHLNADSTNIIHIATHGFYLTKEQFNHFAAATHLSEEWSDNAEDLALIRSGLYFSGVNNVLRRRPIPQGVDDGILTAKEISLMNFRNLDLVVLSACQTALGDIGSDGVFGLQRGFKMAGARSLLMSLWKVDDRATQILMEHFYSALLSGKSKTAALHEAQRMVRNYEVTNDSGKTYPYVNPKFWAAFILLDAI